MEAGALQLCGDLLSCSEPPDFEDAEGSFCEALVLANELGLRSLVAHCRLGLGKLHGCRGNREQALDHLGAAITMYREMEMRLWLEKAEAAATF